VWQDSVAAAHVAAAAIYSAKMPMQGIWQQQAGACSVALGGGG
jgi:hypothetical protein